MIKLHGLDVSGNTYKARLLMSILKIDYEFISIDITNKQHKSDEYLCLNPRGEFPVLEDGGHTIWDSQAILIYLSRKYNGEHLYPNTPIEMALVTQWLTVANGEIFNTLAKARSMLKFGHSGDLAEYQNQGKNILKIINSHLQHSHNGWIATDQVSIADLACYPYIALCAEGEISIKKYTAIHQWIKNIQSIEGYISMPGLPLHSLHIR